MSDWDTDAFFKTLLAFLGAFVVTLAAGTAMAQAPTKPNQTTVQEWLDQAEAAKNVNPQKSLDLANQALALLADREGADLEKSRGFAIRGFAQVRLGEPDLALAAGRQALALAGEDHARRGHAYVAMGAAENRRGEIAPAFRNYRAAIDAFETDGAPLDLLFAFTSIAELYSVTGLIDRAIAHYQSALEIAMENDDVFSEWRVLNNMSAAMIENDRALDAVAYIKDAETLVQGMANPLAFAITYVNASEILAEAGEYEAARKYIALAAREGARLGLPAIQAAAALTLGRVERATGNLNEALQAGHSALAIANRLEDHRRLRDIHQLLYRVEKDLGDVAGALSHYESFIVHRDELSGLETERRTAILDAEYQLSVRDREIAGLRQDHQLSELLLRREQQISAMSTFGAYILLLAVTALVILLRGRARVARLAQTKARELEETRVELEHANQTKSNILAMTSHEVRTPLNGVLGMAHLILQTDLSDQQKQYAETIKSSGDILLAILNDILDLSKIEAGKLDIEPTDFSLRRLIDSVEGLWGPKAEDKGLTFSVEYEPGLDTHYFADANRIRQILFNLVSNAVKFTDAGSVSLRIKPVSLAGNKTGLRFEVRDSGIGIDDQALDRVFEPFQQAQTGAARGYGGTGLGLAICRQLARLLDGDIGAESQPGEGSLFWFEAPCEVVAQSAKQIEGDAPAADRILSARKGGGVRALVAEDNVLNQMIISELLRGMDIGFEIVGNGREAVERVRRTPFDLVLMDIHMPEMNGLEATRAIRALDGNEAQIPIIALTADAMEGDKQRLIDSGLNDYVTKPIDPPALYAAISKQCRDTGAASGAAAGTLSA